MSQYNSLNLKLSNSQLDKLKSAIKNETEVVLRLPSNKIGNFDDKTNFPHELLLTNRQVANLCKAFTYNSSTDIKLTAGASAADARIHKKALGSGATTLIISNDEMEDI